MRKLKILLCLVTMFVATTFICIGGFAASSVEKTLDATVGFTYNVSEHVVATMVVDNDYDVKDAETFKWTGITSDALTGAINFTGITFADNAQVGQKINITIKITNDQNTDDGSSLNVLFDEYSYTATNINYTGIVTQDSQDKTIKCTDTTGDGSTDIVGSSSFTLEPQKSLTVTLTWELISTYYSAESILSGFVINLSKVNE